MRFLISDIHGCFDELMNVVKYSGFNPKRGDVLYSVGDLCDRGSSSAQVLNYIYLLNKNYPNSFQAVFGNHDIWLYQYWDSKINGNSMSRDVWECWEYNGGKTTIKSIGNLNKRIRNSMFKWVGNLPYRIDLIDYRIQHTTIRDEALLSNIEPTRLTLKQCMDEDICGKDYDSWFFDRNVMQSSKVVFGEKAMSNVSYTPTKRPLIIGHSPILGGPCYDKQLNIIMVDTGSFIKKEKYKTDIDGSITILNLDNKQWFRSDNETGVIDLL